RFADAHVQHDQHFYRVMELAIQNRIQLVPVLDEQQEYAGVVTVSDALAAFGPVPGPAGQGRALRRPAALPQHLTLRGQATRLLASPDSLRQLSQQRRPPVLPPVVTPTDTLVQIGACPAAGPRARVFAILFIGNSKTKERILRAELNIREGARFWPPPPRGHGLRHFLLPKPQSRLHHRLRPPQAAAVARGRYLSHSALLRVGRAAAAPHGWGELPAVCRRPGRIAVLCYGAAALRAIRQPRSPVLLRAGLVGPNPAASPALRLRRLAGPWIRGVGARLRC
nr:hypothetical protein [Tanacetum cinerariifolium]